MGNLIKIGLIVLILALLWRFRHVKVKLRTFLKKGFKMNKGAYGVYCYCGKQGQGKTYSVVEFLREHKKMKIYSNVSLQGIEYKKIDGFAQLLDLRSEQNCIIFYDEIFTALTKSSRMTTEILDFLSQMRKRKMIFLTTAQEWLEINITLRRYCRYQIECHCFVVPFINHGILIKNLYDADNMKWSNEDNEYVAPLLETTISKFNLITANCYDTFEQIKTRD